MICQSSYLYQYYCGGNGASSYHGGLGGNGRGFDGMDPCCGPINSDHQIDGQTPDGGGGSTVLLQYVHADLTNGMGGNGSVIIYKEQIFGKVYYVNSNMNTYHLFIIIKLDKYTIFLRQV